MLRSNRSQKMFITKGRGYLTFCLVVVFLCVGFVQSAVADVDVNFEGAYTETDLALYIYADITSAILSYGVKISYDTSELTLSNAEKNEAVWFFGDGTDNHPYMEPETTNPGEVIIIGGKLDTAAPSAGVTGGRVLLGKVFFNRQDTSMPFTPSLNIDLARGGSFDNFVQTDGVVLDGAGVEFSLELHERGDANGSGGISTADYIIIRNSIGSADAPPWVDCNGSETVSTADYVCVRNKM